MKMQFYFEILLLQSCVILRQVHFIEFFLSMFISTKIDMIKQFLLTFHNSKKEIKFILEITNSNK